MMRGANLDEAFIAQSDLRRPGGQYADRVDQVHRRRGDRELVGLTKMSQAVLPMSYNSSFRTLAG